MFGLGFSELIVMGIVGCGVAIVLLFLKKASGTPAHPLPSDIQSISLNDGPSKNDMHKKRISPSSGDIIPVNGPSKFCFMLSDLPKIDLPCWPPAEFKKLGWDEAIAEMQRQWKILRSKKIWSPYPILSYCVGSAEGPVLSDKHRMLRQIIMEDEYNEEQINVRYFLFPLRTPSYEDHAVAQLICKTKAGAKVDDIELWVDALRDGELSDENRLHIQQALR